MAKDPLRQDQDTRRRSNVDEAAVREGTTPERAQRSSTEPVRSAEQPSPAAPGQLRPERLQDGYSDTEGSEYDREDPPPARRHLEEERDPTHSGVRRAPRKPGSPATFPGREEGTAWSENRQTSQGQNPRNPSD